MNTALLLIGGMASRLKARVSCLILIACTCTVPDEPSRMSKNCCSGVGDFLHRLPVVTSAASRNGHASEPSVSTYSDNTGACSTRVMGPCRHKCNTRRQRPRSSAFVAVCSTRRAGVWTWRIYSREQATNPVNAGVLMRRAKVDCDVCTFEPPIPAATFFVFHVRWSEWRPDRAIRPRPVQ